LCVNENIKGKEPEYTQVDRYLDMLDSLARFYNSEITAHVGYVISFTGAVLAIFLTLLPSVIVNSDKWNAYALPLSIPLGTLVVVLVILGVLLYFLAPIPYVSFRYLYARLQFYGELSQITWQHMGLSDPIPPGDYVTVLRERAKAVGVNRAIEKLFAARLFVSRCKSKEGIRKRIRNEDIIRHLDAFEIQAERNGRKERDTIMPLDRSYYTAAIGVLRRLNIQKVDLFWLAYKQAVDPKTREGKLLRLEGVTEEDRKYKKQCNQCGAWSPLASEKCNSCGRSVWGARVASANR
jgi:hypothetical protein